MLSFDMVLTPGPEGKVRGHSVLHRTPAGSELRLAVLLSMDQRSEGSKWERNMIKGHPQSHFLEKYIVKIIYAHAFLLLGNVGLDKLLQNTRIVDVGAPTSTQVPISLSDAIQESKRMYNTVSHN